MPLRLNVGLTRKVGLPEYSSVGASCHVEVELDSGLLDDPDGLRAKARCAYAACRRAVDDELNQQRTKSDAHANGSAASTNGHHRNGFSSSERRRESANGHSHRTRKPATAAQIRAIHAIANSRSLDLTDLLHERFGLPSAEELSSADASRLIDELKYARNDAVA